MIIKHASQSDKDRLLEVVDLFNDFANSLDSNWDGKATDFSRKHSGELYDVIVNSNQSALFFAEEDNNIAGFIEIHKVPRLRKAKYYAEIELMFVKEEYRGTDVAQKLMKAVIKWGEEYALDCIRLYSGFELKRAHAFYEKMGFKHAGRTYKYTF